MRTLTVLLALSVYTSAMILPIGDAGSSLQWFVFVFFAQLIVVSLSPILYPAEKCPTNLPTEVLSCIAADTPGQCWCHIIISPE
jgi:hypothetical protein